MSPLRVYFDPADAPRTPLDSAIEWLLAALLVFCPFAFGAVEAWSEQVVIAICAAIALCLAAKLILRRDARFVASWAILPIALFLLFVPPLLYLAAFRHVPQCAGQPERTAALVPI